MFKRDKVMKFFNLDNLDEPFIDAVETAEFLNTSRGNVHRLAREGVLPNYKLKAGKGSAFLFKKSELDNFLDIEIERSTEPINLLLSYKIMKEISLDLLNQTIENKESRQYKIMYGILAERKSLTTLSEELGISRQAINQSCENTAKRMIDKKYYSALAYVDLERQIIVQKREIEILKSNLMSNKALSMDIHNLIVAEKFVELLDKDIDELYIGRRGENVLRKANIHSIYELAKFYYKQDGLIKMQGLRNMGHKSIVEIKEALEEVSTKLSNQTGGFSLPALLRSDIMDKNYEVWNEIKKKMIV